MKKILFIVLLAPFALHAQDVTLPFKLSGKIKIKGLEPAKVFLQYRTGGEWKTDSIEVKGNKYSFSGNLDEPVQGRLRVSYSSEEKSVKEKFRSKRDLAIVFLETGKIKVSSIDSFSNIKVKGSAAHTAYQAVTKQLKPLTEKRQKLVDDWYAANEKKDDEAKKEIEEQIDDLDGQIREEKGAIFRKNPRSPIALTLLKEYAGWDIDADKVQPLFNMLPEKDKKYPSAITFKEDIEVAAKTGIGKIAMDFTQNDTLDNPVQLSSFRGRYVLIDFWASWCGPCRVENPNVVKVFNKYKDSNFHIVGVSLDRPGQKDKWLKAIHDDHLTWTHVSDLKFWDNEVAQQYGIKAIPQNLLLNPEGKIIAKNLYGEELEEKLGAFIGDKKSF
ncbi:MAG TPA: redoxin domain-containing protein [Chitinophagaceae bacterium]|nr:redoxin domain-containing protein [Chitinophagales bacterium]HRX93648.1 redoxin domain-containing protein [Chitinophagaceae bacterium]